MPVRINPLKDALVLAHAEEVRRNIEDRTARKRGCLLYAFVHSFTGYGMVSLRGLQMGAHRCALLLSAGPAPPDKPMALHKCRARNCVEVSHLYWGDAADNLADKIRDGTHKSINMARGDRHPASVMTTAQAIVIWMDYHDNGGSIAALARKHRISERAVYHLFSGECRSDVTKHLPSISSRKKEMSWNRGERAWRAGLREAQVVEIYLEYATGRTSMFELAKRHGCTRHVVASIAHRRTWRSVTKALPRISKAFIAGETRRHMSPLSRITADHVRETRRFLKQGMDRKKIAMLVGIKHSDVHNIACGTTGPNVT